MWGGQGFSEWMWTVAFDGIGSTLAATVVAVLLVLRQLGNDREQNWEAAFLSDCRAVMARTRELQGDMKRVVVRAQMDFPEYQQWSSELLHLTERVAVREPCLHALLHAARDQAASSRWSILSLLAEEDKVDAGGINGFWAALESVVQILGGRVNSPDIAKGMSRERCDGLVEVIRRGETVQL